MPSRYTDVGGSCIENSPAQVREWSLAVPAVFGKLRTRGRESAPSGRAKVTYATVAVRCEERLIGGPPEKVGHRAEQLGALERLGQRPCRPERDGGLGVQAVPRIEKT